MKSFLKAMLFLTGWMAAGWIFWKFRTPEPLVLLKIPPVAVEPAPALEPAPAPNSHQANPIQVEFGTWAAKPELRSALVGFVVLDEKGNIAFSTELGKTALCPASALKTLTTGAAFGMLGTDFRFETHLDLRPDGNLAIVGSGDPTLTLANLDELAAAVVAGGLEEVSGALVADASVFSTPPANDHWNWGDIGNAYGAGAFGLNVEHNRMRVRFQPAGKPGDPAKFVDGGPVSTNTRWIDEVTIGPPGSGDRVSIYSTPGGNEIWMRGTVPKGDIFGVYGAIPDPPALVLEKLRSALEIKGVRFLHKPVSRKGETVVLANHRSAPLPEIIDHLHKVSDNLEAQCLFLTIGKRSGKDASVTVREFWEKAGVNFEGLRLIDGSGLARANMIRPLDLARVNFAARHGTNGQRYFQSLNPSLAGGVRAKLGAMSGVKTDVGFLHLENGREFTFALMANGLDPQTNFWPLRDELLEAVRRAAGNPELK